MANIPEDEKEQSEFDEVLDREEALNPETKEKDPVPDVESPDEKTTLEGKWQLEFNGQGAELFGIFIKNFMLNVLTLGIYYPWAKARQLRYYYGASRISDSDFQFHGTGKEMLIGLGKAVVVLVFLDLAYEGILSVIFNDWLLGLTGILYAFIFFILIMIASVGARRYRMSRTSWRGIRFRFLGTFKDTVFLVSRGWLLSLLSLGFYYPFYLNRFQDYWTSKTTFGNIPFSYDGQGKDVFGIWLKGTILTILTLGIYLFWLKANLQRYFWQHTTYGEVRINSTLYGGKWLWESLIVLLFVILTLGIGGAWAVVRYKKFYLGTLSLAGKIDLAQIKQSEAKMTGATGEGMADFFDVEM
jgi:uncharacterized membrane protein YjgN (DUF898 family)